MNTFSINIFDDTPSSSDNIINFRPESTSLNAPDLMPLNNNTDERFQQNRIINGKTKYEEENTIIKSLEEEIINMKHKLSFVYEKDEEIGKLKEEIRVLKKNESELSGYMSEVQTLRSENKQLKSDLELANIRIMNIETLNSENKLLKDKLNTISTKEESKEIIDEVEDIEEIERDEMIQVNIPQLKNVLLNRLKNKQEEHIDTLISTYGFNKQRQVKRSIMEKMLEQAIHL